MVYGAYPSICILFCHNIYWYRENKILPDRLMVSRAFFHRSLGHRRGILYKFIFTAAGSSNGRTPGFGPGDLGSSPSPAAVNRNTKYLFCVSRLLESRTPGLHHKGISIYIVVITPYKLGRPWYLCSSPSST